MGLYTNVFIIGLIIEIGKVIGLVFSDQTNNVINIQFMFY